MPLAENWDVTKPAGGDNPQQGDDEIRQERRAIQERAQRGNVYWPAAVDQDAGKIVLGTDPDGLAGTWIVFESNAHAGNRTTTALQIWDGGGATPDTARLGDGVGGSRPYTFQADVLQGKREHTVHAPLPGGATGRQGGVLFENRGGGTLTVLEALAVCFIAPSVSPCTIDVHRLASGWTDPNSPGTSIGTAPPLLSIPVGTFRSSVVTTFSTATLAVGDAWVFDIDALNSADLIVVEFKIRRTS